MRTQSPDTSEAAERVQLALLREAGVAGRSRRMCSLTQSAVRLAVRALARAHRDWTNDELLVGFVELNYGAELAESLRRDLVRRGRLP